MPATRKVAFAIGVGDAAPLPYLGGAVNGAHDFHAWASKLGYEAQLVTDETQPVTIERLRAELLAKLDNPNPPVHRLVIYFAGHGLIREAEEGLWLLSDWNNQLRAVAVEGLKRRLYRFSVEQIAIFADSCRSLPPNIDAADLVPDPVLGRGPSPTMNDPAIDKFIAAQDGSATFMIPGETEAEDRCLFTGVLMEGLWGLNPGAFSVVQPKLVTSNSLGAYLKKEVDSRAKIYKRSLQPSVSPTFPDGDNVYFGDGTPPPQPPAFPPWPPSLPDTGGPGGPGGPTHPLILGTTRDNRVGVTSSIDDGPETVSGAGPKAGDSGPTLLEKLRKQDRPDHFETGSGLAVAGGAVRNVWTTADVVAEQHGKENWWRLRQGSDNRLQLSAPLLVEFDDGLFAAATGLPNFIVTMLRERRGVAGQIYRQIGWPPQASQAAEEAISRMESGGLRIDEAADLAANIRQWKHADPTLGVIAAYLYDAIDDVENIRRMAYFYIEHNQPIPYDIALLALLDGERRHDRLWAKVPAVAPAKPRTGAEAALSWTHEATPAAEGEVGGFWPWMRQGWTLLSDPADGGSALIVPGLADLSEYLSPARFATLNSKGAEALAAMFTLAPAFRAGP